MISSILSLKTDIVIEVTSLVDRLISLTSYINDATVVARLANNTIQKPTVNGAVTNEGSGNVGIALTGNTLVAGQKIFLVGTMNYDGLRTLVSGTSVTKLVFAATYVAETLSGLEHIYHIVLNADAITLNYISASNGVYRGVLPSNIDIHPDSVYYLFIQATSGAYTAMTRTQYTANYM